MSIDLMYLLAQRFHAGQQYGDFPYVEHLKQVERSVASAYPRDERLRLVAIGHDLLEDTECTAQTLRGLFEDHVVDAIEALTKRKGEPRAVYLTRVLENPMAIKVKLHDALCNLTESVSRGDMKRVQRYAETVKFLAGGMD